MNLFELNAKISVDDTGFKKSMENAQKVSKNVANAMKELQSPLDKAKSGFNAIAHPVETTKANIEKLKNATEAIRHPIETFKQKVSDASTALETKRNKLSALSAVYDSAKKKVDDLTKEFNKSAKESGTSSEKTQKLAKKLNEAEREAAKAKKELDDYSESVSKAGKKSESASNGIGKFGSILGKGLKTAVNVGAAAVGAASTAIVALGKIGIEYNSQMEQYTTNFTTMLGSKEAAVQKVEELKKFAASTPLSMDDLAQGTQTLLAFGVESENSTGILRQLGDIALGNADKMQRLATAFGKATAAGKVTGDTVQQMIDAGWNPLIQISKAAGETMEETQKRMSAGAISVEELQAAMEAVTSGTGQFAGGMEAASHTTQGLISTLQDNVKSKIGEAFQSVSDILQSEVLPRAIEFVNSINVDSIIENVNGLVSTFIELSPVIAAATAATIAYKAAVSISEVIDLVRKATEGQTIAQAALNAVMNANPFVLVTTLIVGLVAAIVTLWNTNEGFRNAVISAWEAIKSAADTIFTAIANFFTETIPNAFQSMIDWISNGISSFVDIGHQIVDSIMSGISAAWDGLVSWFNGIWNSLFGGRSVDVNVNADATSDGVNGSHAGGLPYVPFDGYIAELHRGERVLTASEARGYNNRSNSEYDERPIKIVVQSVLDGKVIGETAYNYNRRKARAGGT